MKKWVNSRLGQNFVWPNICAKMIFFGQKYIYSPKMIFFLAKNTFVGKIAVIRFFAICWIWKEQVGMKIYNRRTWCRNHAKIHFISLLKCSSFVQFLHPAINGWKIRFFISIMWSLSCGWLQTNYIIKLLIISNLNINKNNSQCPIKNIFVQYLKKLECSPISYLKLGQLKTDMFSNFNVPIVLQKSRRS